MTIEIRRDPPSKACPEGEVDEVVGRGFLHLERMGHSQFMLIFYGEQGDELRLMLEPKVWPKRGRAAHVRARVWAYDAAAPRRTDD